MPLGGTSRRKFLSLLGGEVAAPIVITTPGLLMPVKALPLALPTFVFNGPVAVVEQSVATDQNPVLMAARLFRSMGFPLNIPEVRKLARLCAEPVPCELAATSLPGNSAGVA